MKWNTFTTFIFFILSVHYFYVLFNNINNRFNADARGVKAEDFFTRSSEVWQPEFMNEYKSCRFTNFSEVFARKNLRLKVWPNAPTIRGIYAQGPGNGLGNQLIGFAQGVILAKLSERQLFMEWRFHNLFEHTFLWKPHKDFLSSSKFSSLHPYLAKSSKKNHFYEGSYRDKICSILSPNSLQNLSRRDVRFRSALLELLQIDASREKEWYDRKNICVLALSCLLKHTLKPTQMLRRMILEVTSSLSAYEELIALHVRLGDKEMIGDVSQDRRDIHYDSDRFLPLSFGTNMLSHAIDIANSLKSNRKSVRFFVSTDSPSFYKVAKERLGSELLATESIGLIGLTEYGNEDVLIRAAVDLAILSLSQNVVCGPWSTFINTALVWGYSSSKNVTQCKYKHLHNLNYSETVFSCQPAELKDYWKGPKPE